MKKLLFLLMMPIICFGQGGYYDENKSDISKICDFYRGNSFASNISADNALDRILSVTGMSKRFVLYPCSNIDNCLATSFKGIRYILYDKEFMKEIAENTSSWSRISILAHEVGHHVNGHSVDILSLASGQIDPPSLEESRRMEIEADEFSGFVMQKLGASLAQAKFALEKYASSGDDSYSTHPSKQKRLAAVEKGYLKAKVQSNSASNRYPLRAEQKVYSNTKITAEDFFYIAKNTDRKNYKTQIENYSKAIELNPSFTVAYYSRGVSRFLIDDYSGAIEDFNKAIELKPNYADAYKWRGSSKYKINDCEGAILDYNKAIELNPKDIDFTYYENRGIILDKCGYPVNFYWKDGKATSSTPCDDFKKACELGGENSCINYLTCLEGKSNKDATSFFYTYNKSAKVKYKNKDYSGAIRDLNKSIELNPNFYISYYIRGKMYYLLDNLDYKALMDFNASVELAPYFFDGHKWRGIFLIQREIADFKNALNAFNKAIEIRQDNSEVYAKRGLCKAMLKLNHCSDMKKACSLGDHSACDFLCPPSKLNEFIEKEENKKNQIRDAELKAMKEYEAKLKREAEVKAEYEAKLKREAEVKAEYEAKLREEIELEVKAEYEAKLREEIELEVKAENEAKLKREAEANAKENIEVKLEPAVKPSNKIQTNSVQLLDITQNNMQIFDYSTLEIGDQVIFKFLGTNRGIIKRVIGDGKEYIISNVEYSPWETSNIQYGDYRVKYKKILGYKKSN